MSKSQWIVIVTISCCLFSLANCTKVKTKSIPAVSEVSDTEPRDAAIDVMIYTGSASWLTLKNAIVEAGTTKRILDANGINAVITDNEENLSKWMSETTANGVVNICILYGVIPSSIYTAGNTQPDGSIAESWIETTDGDTILNQGDYFGYYSSNDTPNYKATLQNLMDLPDIDINVEFFDHLPMMVTDSGKTLSQSLDDFKSDRPFPLVQIGGGWYAEKILASNTGDEQGTLVDPIILRDGVQGRLAMVHQTHHGDNPKGTVAAEIIINYLLAEKIQANCL